METDTIDLRKILRIIKQRFLIIVLTVVAALAISSFYSFFILDESYEANSLLYVWQDESESGSIQYNDLMMYSQLVNDYQVLVKSRLVTDQVVGELGLDASVSDALANKISVDTKNNTRHLTISATDKNPEIAAVIANTVAGVFSNVVIEKMGAANVQIIDHAVPPASPSYPNRKLNIAIGLVLGLMAGVLIVFAIEFFDISVKDADDIEAVVEFTQLGVIPDFTTEAQNIRGMRG